MKIIELKNGNKIIIGNNATENFIIIDNYLKYNNGNSLWFHVKNLHVMLF